MEVWREELYHHGILGQKWGVRRYQNEDGTYTKAGLERYGDAYEKYENAKEKLKNSGKSYKEGRSSLKNVGSSAIGAIKARRDLSKSYQDLKYRNDVDKGRDLYSRGKSIQKNEAKLKKMSNNKKKAGAVIAAGSAIVGGVVLMQTKSIKSAAITAGMAATMTASMRAYKMHTLVDENKKMRAYTHADKVGMNEKDKGI